MTEPDDRELEAYLKGGGKLSRKYREASREAAPPELDDRILAQARAEVSRRRRRVGPWLSGLALAASVVLAVNLGWNVHRAKPQLGETAEMKDVLADKGFVPNPPSSPAAREPAPPAASGGMASIAEDARQKQASEDRLAQRQRRQEAEMARRDEAARESSAAAAAPSAAAPAMALAPPQAQREMAPAKATPVALTEPEKIDRLIAYIGGLQGAKFVRNGTEYGPDEAVSHLQLKRRNAGSRVKTAEDFIKYCASFSSVSGEAYLIKFADGRTRTAEDVLREELARINAGD